MRKSLFSLVLFLIVAAPVAGFVAWISAAIGAPGPLAQEKIVYIAPGTSAKGISAQLETEGIVSQGWIFALAARLDSAHSLKAGEYLFPPALSLGDVLALLQSGRTHQRQVTIPEGLMSFEIVKLLNTAEVMEGEITDIPPEGSLLPETYNYTRGMNRADLLARMQRDFRTTLDALWQDRDPGSLLKTPEEAVILASIVEKETGIASERPRVAGVFINRLRQGMPLQSDPTVIYAITEGKYALDRPLLRKDLNMPSPYNTYVTPGLPPTPIANPGKAALTAVLNPESHDFLYFVADGSGGHAFGKTHDEHLRNVGQWREIQKSTR